MNKIMYSPKGVKSGVPERVSIFCPHVVPITIYLKQLETTVSKQIIQHM